jgi:hypothetical protein
MSFWWESDISGFNRNSSNQIGQINLNSHIGKYLYELSLNNDYNTFLEIGTWNGMGSTKCFIEGFKRRTAPFLFYSLECNTEKWAFANNLYKNIDNVYILNEVILNTMPDDIFTIFPEILKNDDFNYWNKIDFNNMRDKPLFLDRNELPKMFDVLLLDGGEFTTWYEYQQLKNKCKIIILDDTNVPKCKKIVEDLKNQQNKWNLIFENDERNGCAAFALISR